LSELERFVLGIKNLPDGKKDLRTVKSEAQNRRKKTVATQKRFAGAIVSSPGSLLHILIEIRLSSWTALAHATIALAEKSARWQIVVLPLAVFAAPKSLD
jgi:hypothetical protein